MGIKYGSLNVDEKYSSILEPNLFADSFLSPGVTYTDQYEEGAAGGIYVHKLSTTAVEPGTPGRDFSDEAIADELIQILLNNNYQKSKKIYGVQANAVSFPVADEALSLATAEVKEGRQLSALACLVQEGTADGDSADITDATGAFLKSRELITTAKGKSNVVLCHPEYFTMLLAEAGEKFTPVRNDRIAETGAIGTYMGHLFIECPQLAATQGKYYDSTGNLKTVSFANVQYIMYNYMALSIVDNLEAMRIVDSENFVGSKAQVEMNTGFKVTNPKLAIVRKKTGE